ncbi:NADH-quinone oxidoreductase subunit G [Rhodospirillaceae bacterium KN72]|uniref:NADH-quinone oxidoreductase n=1 Tax=Pacificispira spongiicola TaxID=2729598 RepID=A0A7Y0E2J1_9PROT|nr:NADH-quinone oxidoreductase subunit NuoG [Pacificispira spongiicola]NMM46034.1 NADH-quinone oxidoreductase subunit G [Pacificispira spongiicola]
MATITVKINGEEHEVEQGMTVLQACEQAGVEIPRFCYHERLSVAGNCRMCLVEVKPGPPKPAASCALPVAPNQEIFTDTPMVHKARNGVMEFLLINHPLDCPICDQGGECDLQDQAMAYGRGGSRYHENKRAVKDKYMGPLINTIMTRCIHCTRCVRFSAEVAGVEEIGLLNRGENAEISTLEKALDSEMSANVIDLCPVGALTSKPYAFEARPWELKKTESVDVMDAVGSNIRVDTRGNEVLRVLPRLNEDVNEEWISDKTRYACDGLRRQRLDRPYVRGEDGKLKPATWPEAMTAIAGAVKGMKRDAMAAIVGDQADAESVYSLKKLMASLGVANLDCRQDGAKLDATTRAGYIFNTTIAGIDEADALLIVGSNIRWEAPIINARIRKRWMGGQLKVASIGPQVKTTFDVDYLGAGPETLSDVASGKHPFAKILKDAEKPMIIVGMGAINRPDGAAVLATAKKLADDFGMVKDGWNGFNVLHTAASRVGALDLGFVPGEGGKSVPEIVDGAASGAVKFVYLLGADEVDLTGGKAFVVYQGHHGDRGAHAADVILPGAAYTEKNATFVNTEGRVQLARRAAFPPGEAKDDWAILRALSETLGKALPWIDFDGLRKAMREEYPHLARIDDAEAAEWGDFGTAGEMNAAPFKSPIDNFYMTDPISRASETMAECTQTFVLDRQSEGTGTNG